MGSTWQLAASLQDHGLAMAADIGDQLNPAGRVHQGAAFALVRQCPVVAWLGYRQFVTDIARAALEEDVHLAAVQRLVEVTGNRELAVRLLQLKT